jgi:hypothetical protein
MSEIRKITVGKEIKDSVSYVCGGKPPFAKVSGMESFTITQITEKEDKLYIYVTNQKNETHLWKKLPINDSTTIEYKIDE